MKKILTAGAVFLLVGSVQASSAEEQKVGPEEIPTPEVQHAVHRDWAISGYIGIADFESEEKPDPFRPGVSHEMESEKAFKFGVVFSRYYNDFSFNLGIEYIPDAEVTDEADNVLAEHSHIPISLGVNYHFDTRLIDPYIGAGIGYSFNDSAESDFIAKQGMSGEHDHSMFYYLTVGAEYPVSDRYSVFLAGQYTIGDVDMTGSATHPELGEIQIEDEHTLDRYELNLGVKYFF